MRGGEIDMNETEGTFVVGLGNIIHTDDGAGVHALRRLERDPRVPDDVVFIDGGTLGIELLAQLKGATRLLLLDAVDTGERAGTVVRMTARDLAGLKGGASVHQIGVADLLAVLPLISAGPKETVLLGVQVVSTDWGTELTPPIEAALDLLVDAATEQLIRWETSRELGIADANCESHFQLPCGVHKPECAGLLPAGED